MPTEQFDIVIGGSSITDSHPWPTWATWTVKKYGGHSVFNTSVKGMGNEAIIARAVYRAKLCSNPLLLLQLTNVDKWDWYVDRPNLVAELSREKHPLTRIDDSHLSGFWSTGSHFPHHKQHYYQNYFSLSYQMYHTLQLIHWLQLFCQQKGWKYHIVFDSPILSVTEQQLNLGQLDLLECNSNRLVQNPLCQLVFDMIDLSNIYCPGLIGFALCNNYPWFSPRAKGHPGSLVHYHFTRQILEPILDQWLIPTHDLAEFEQEAKIMQKLFDAY